MPFYGMSLVELILITRLAELAIVSITIIGVVALICSAKKRVEKEKKTEAKKTE